MGQSFFIWKGIDCRSMGVILRGPAPIVRPEERVKHVEIPGVAGDYTETEGEDIYNSYIQTVTLTVRDHVNVRRVYSWLRGSGYVTFSGEPDRRQAARIIGAVTLNRISRNMDAWTGEVQFYCQPLKELLWPKDIVVAAYSAPVEVYNAGDVKCFPVYTVTASAATVKVAAGDSELTVTGCTSGQVLRIDTKIMEVWTEVGGVKVLLTADSSGAFPALEAGDNTVTLTGASAVRIEKRERYL